MNKSLSYHHQFENIPPECLSMKDVLVTLPTYNMMVMKHFVSSSNTFNKEQVPERSFSSESDSSRTEEEEHPREDPSYFSRRMRGLQNVLTKKEMQNAADRRNKQKIVEGITRLKMLLTGVSNKQKMTKSEVLETSAKQLNQLQKDVFAYQKRIVELETLLRNKGYTA
ncbi:hypothetical protein BY458DRAFT_557803 [Sporodiniella umbellata]|nr:hypothetical protein BY458DRAFT_557803 [Sporodiniella umbellata]